ncbi:MAG: ABC transporter permease subunit [Clostridiales bacterium]|nr:ABC transporter permease subunit [Clostridiales bacterium]
MSKIVRNALIGLFWIAVWWIAAAAVGLPLLLPGPGDTLSALFRLMKTSAFWQSTFSTLLRVACGYGCAVVLGILLAIGCHFIRVMEALMSPIRSVIKATPVSSFIILVLLWISKGTVPAFISFLMVLPIIWTAVQEALRATDGQLLEMTQAYHFTPAQRLRYLYAPSVKPGLAASCITGLGFAWKSGIAAEVIALPLFSVGTNLYNAKIYLESADLFAWTFTVILLSIALEAMLKKALGRLKGGAA